MSKVLLKPDYVKDLPFTNSGQAFTFDEALSGFGLRIGIKSKAYIVEGRVKGKTRRLRRNSLPV